MSYTRIGRCLSNFTGIYNGISNIILDKSGEKTICLDLCVFDYAVQ